MEDDGRSDEVNWGHSSTHLAAAAAHCQLRLPYQPASQQASQRQPASREATHRATRRCHDFLEVGDVALQQLVEEPQAPRHRRPFGLDAHHYVVDLSEQQVSLRNQRTHARTHAHTHARTHARVTTLTITHTHARTHERLRITNERTNDPTFG